MPPFASAKKIDKFRLVDFFIQAAGLAYHHDAVVDIIKGACALASHHAPACIFRGLMIYNGKPLVIYNSCGIDDIHAYGVM
ncbi:MAG: hypothetical protein IKC52_04530 [Clostridia bacterium]|nr:hypothetical protein [Clostridia bacterium]